MGLESFFVKVKLADYNRTSIAPTHPSLITEWDTTVQGEQVLTLNGCFSWYEPCMDAMWDTIETIAAQDKNRQLIMLDEEVNVTNRDEFKRHLTHLYAPKADAFRNTYGDVHFISKPGASFYRNLRWHRLFRLFKLKVGGHKP